MSLPPVTPLARIVAVFVVCGAIVALALLLTGHRGSGAVRSPAEKVQVQKRVATLFADIPQHGVILGRRSAPVTLQVFVDLEDYADGTNWFNFKLPAILKQLVRPGIVRLEFHSFKTDTLNGGPFVTQQTAALAAGAQNRLWNYAATFIGEQGTEFTNYANESFVTGIAEQVPGLNIARWEKSRTVAMSKIVMADNYNARYRWGFHATPAFRIGLTGSHTKNFSGQTIIAIPKYVVRTRPSGERYIAGVSHQLQHPVSLIDVSDLKQAVEELVCPRRSSCPATALRQH